MRHASTLRPLYLRHLLVAFTVAALAAPAIAGQWQFNNVERIVAIGDVHGAYDAMLTTLQNAKIIDKALAWSGGKSHLVFTGDILDRGPDSRTVMNLLMRLEEESVAAGGRVHVLLGNHELMNLVGDLRYVSKAAYAAFAGEESAQERLRWSDVYVKWRATSLRSAEERRLDFEQRFPEGFFARRLAFASGGKYGEWLLSKPIIIVINGTAFVHGGLSPMVSDIGLQGVNETLRGGLATYVKQLEVLFDAEVLLPTDNFFDHPELLNDFEASNRSDIRIAQAVTDIRTLNNSDLHALNGPLWYRGNVVCSPLVETDRLAASLQAIEAKRVVVGHTPTVNHRVLERLDGRVIEIDTGMLNSHYKGLGHALIIEGDDIRVVDQNNGHSQPKQHPRRVGRRVSDQLEADEVEALLKTGDIVSRSKAKSGRTPITIDNGSLQLKAVFVKRAAPRFYPEVAAYRIDRLLKLNMVPITVRRELDGIDGSLQLLPENWIGESQRRDNAGGGSAWCPLPPQWNAMFVFDALIYNLRRDGENIIYDQNFWQLMLVDNNASFAAKRGKPKYLRKTSFTVGTAWKQSLAELSDERIADALGDVLDKKRMRFLAIRRDELLQAE